MHRDAADIAAMFWAEDVLRKAVPSAVGVWWRDEYDPSALLAPCGAILPSCVRRMEVQHAPAVDGDEDLLAAMPATRMVAPQDLASPFAYVTCCVDSSAELITPMVQSPARRRMGFQEFARALGGSVREGRRLLDVVFPDYAASGMDMARDPFVRYYASQFDGMPCLYVAHSAIEYVFQRTGLRQAPRLGEQDTRDFADDAGDAPGASPA
jgi:hypothetical protein